MSHQLPSALPAKQRTVTDFPDASPGEPPSCFIPQKYTLPTRPIAKALERLEENSNTPGLVREDALKPMVMRFWEAFGGAHALEGGNPNALDKVLTQLRERTAMRWGSEAAGMIDWEHNTSRVFSLFVARLNIFERIFFTVDVGESSSIASRFISITLILTIILSILCWMLSTLPEMQTVPETCDSIEPMQCMPQPGLGFKVIEYLCVYIFTVEYLVRLGTAHSVRFELLDEGFLQRFLQSGDEEVPKLDGLVTTTVKWVLRPSSVIDLLSVLPFWADYFAGSGGGQFFLILRILRLTRIFRVFKLGKYNEVFSLFGRVVKQSLPALYLMLFFILLGLCLFGSLIYVAEQGVWYPPGHPMLAGLTDDRGAYLRDGSRINGFPELEESPFASIIHSFWFVIVTITTVGYGDLSPVTRTGKVVGAVMILSGIIVLAMPVGVIGSNFSVEYNRIQRDQYRRKKLMIQREMEQAMLKSAARGEDEEVELTEDIRRMHAILDKAIAIEAELAELLSEESKHCVQQDMRQFLHMLVISRDEVITVDLRAKLDDMLFGAFEHLRAILSHKPGAIPGPLDILQCRQHFVELSELVTVWWVNHPPRPIPHREFRDMKASLFFRLPSNSEQPPGQGLGADYPQCPSGDGGPPAAPRVSAPSRPPQTQQLPGMPGAIG